MELDIRKIGIGIKMDWAWSAGFCDLGFVDCKLKIVLGGGLEGLSA